MCFCIGDNLSNPKNRKCPALHEFCRCQLFFFLSTWKVGVGHVEEMKTLRPEEEEEEEEEDVYEDVEVSSPHCFCPFCLSLLSLKRQHSKNGSFASSNARGVGKRLWIEQALIFSRVFSWLTPTRRAGHFRYFGSISIIKNDFIAFLIKSITFFCTSPI